MRAPHPLRRPPRSRPSRPPAPPSRHPPPLPPARPRPAPAPGMSVPGATQILPRLVLGGILITTAHDWTRLVIEVNNAACDLVVSGTLPRTLTELAWSAMEPMLLLAFLVRAVLLVLLVLQ